MEFVSSDENQLSPISPKTLDKFDIYKKITLNKVDHNMLGTIYNINLPNFDHHPEAEDDVLDIRLFSSYLATILTFYNRNIDKNNVCLYNLDLTEMNLLEYFIAIDFVNWNIRIPSQSLDWINTYCSQNESVSLLILPIRLEFINNDIDLSSDISCSLDNPLMIDPSFKKKDLFSAHSNLIIIDKLLKKIEFYEPHGNQIGIANANLFNVEAILEQTIRTILPFTENYGFVNVSNICPYGFGAQTIQNLQFRVGHCLAWSLYFILLRLYNQNITERLIEQNEPFLSSTQILNHFVTTTSDSVMLNSNIRKFISFLKELSNEKLLINLDIGNIPEKTITLDLIMANLIDINLVTMRIQMLTKAFCKQQLLFNKTDQAIIFKELFSYHKFHVFNKIFIQSLFEYIVNNFVCFIHYERLSKLTSNTFDQTSNLLNSIILNYINSFLDNSPNINRYIDQIIQLDKTESFYQEFFKSIVSILLDLIILDYQNFASKVMVI